MDSLGLLEARNVSVAVIHYSSPGVLLYFLLSSRLFVVQSGVESITAVREPLWRRLFKWILPTAIFTYVQILCFVLIRSQMGLR
jgi:hypothetical protein